MSAAVLLAIYGTLTRIAPKPEDAYTKFCQQLKPTLSSHLLIHNHLLHLQSVYFFKDEFNSKISIGCSLIVEARLVSLRMPTKASKN